MIVYVGSYTGPERASGISVFRQDPASGDLAPLGSGAPTDNPSFLALHPRLPVLYAVNETAPEESPGPGISAFSVDHTHRQASPRSTASHPTAPLRATSASIPMGSVSSSPTTVTAPSPSTPCEWGGALGEATCVIQHEEAAPTHARPLVHTPTPSASSPTGRYFLACDLGCDPKPIYRLYP